MEKKRKVEIAKIEAKKNAAIDELKNKHEKKYNDIKDYYSEITRTNMDMIKTLRGDLKDEQRKMLKAIKDKNIEEAANNDIMKPLEALKKEIILLKEEKRKHDDIRDKLTQCQKKIVETETAYKEIEWEYEVKLQ